MRSVPVRVDRSLAGQILDLRDSHRKIRVVRVNTRIDKAYFDPFPGKSLLPRRLYAGQGRRGVHHCMKWRIIPDHLHVSLVGELFDGFGGRESTSGRYESKNALWRLQSVDSRQATQLVMLNRDDDRDAFRWIY